MNLLSNLVFKVSQRYILLSAFLLLFSANTFSQQRRVWRRVLNEQRPEFFKSEEARRVGDQVLLYQRITGGWPKNTNMVRPLSESERDSLLVQKQRIDDSTVDNNATTTQMAYLARLYAQTGDTRYKESVLAGIEYLLPASMRMAAGRSSGLIRQDIRYTLHITMET